jgi:hypothetical protein
MHDVVMRDAGHVSTPINVRPRQINEADIPEVVNLLTRGFGRERSRGFWESVFAGLGRRRVPAGFPRYGYVIESDGRLVGVLLMIFSTSWKDETASVRCNGSSLYVDPSFRIYAPLLTSRQFKDKSVTVLNVTAARYTYRMVEASGFTKYSNGVFFAIPAFSQMPSEKVRIIGVHDEPDAPFNRHDRELLLEHADCLSITAVQASAVCTIDLFQWRRGFCPLCPAHRVVSCAPTAVIRDPRHEWPGPRSLWQISCKVAKIFPRAGSTTDGGFSLYGNGPVRHLAKRATPIKTFDFWTVIAGSYLLRHSE